jgi:hypothetical protein
VIGNREHPGPWETFTIEHLEGPWVGIRTTHGTHLEVTRPKEVKAMAQD